MHTPQEIQRFKIFQTSSSRPAVIFLPILLCLCLTLGCAKISLKGQQPPTGAGSETGTATSAPQADPLNVTGHWKVGFKYNETAASSTMQLVQQGNSFSGKGTDDTGGTPFTVDNGQINNGQVTFYKKYAATNRPPVEYSGQLELSSDPSINGPYMSGEYTTGTQGKIVTGPWEAAKIQETAAAPLVQESPPEQQPAPVQPAVEGPHPHQGLPNWPADRAPHLSGKWDVAFEYNFAKIRSSMFLEQDGDKILGHGTDRETNEKFVIEKGWYKFPNLTVIRKYKKGKGAASDRTMIFKATVDVVNDKDYSGPYLHGKTNGGGSWEGQLIK